MLGPHIVVQLLPQLAMWWVMSGRCVVVDPWGDTSLLLTTHYMTICGKNCAILYDPSITQIKMQISFNIFFYNLNYVLLNFFFFFC